jgi:filamentous hemagglutinin family protein
MSVRKFNQIKPIHPSPRRLSLRLSPVCHAIALMLAAGATMDAHAATNLANIGAQMSAARNAAAAGGGVNLGVGVSPQQALQASQPSIQNLAHAAQGIAQQIAAQQAAAAAGLNTASNVPNGLAVGGLQVAPGVSSNTNNPALWINANLPTQTVNANGTVDVDVQQTAQNAVVTWQTMNVGRQTTLNFDQSAGTQSNGANNWVILNRIMDPSGAPSQILGNVTAQGSVYVINRNGILFGAGSQVNVHSLVASSLDLLNQNDDLLQSGTDIAASNKEFLSQLGGIAAETVAGSTGNGTVEVLGIGNQVQVNSAADYQAPGNVTIEAGASITTHTNGDASDGGFVLIAAPNVTNAGTITTTNGQAILAAGIGVGFGVSTGQVLNPQLTGQLTIGASEGAIDVTPAGTLINTGLIQGDKGYINLLGSNILQNGVVGVTTGVSYPGGIIISTIDEVRASSPGGTYTTESSTNPVGLSVDPLNEPADRRAGQLVFGPGSVTADLPEEDGETTTSDQNSAFTPGSIAITAGSVWFQGGSLIEAPGATVSVAALMSAAPAGDTAVQGRIYLDTGATIDVSGLSNVELPIADELVTIPLIGQNELADSPLLRDGFLDGLKNVVVDSTLSGTNLDGSQWVGSPVLNLAGYVSLIPRTVDQLLINGGTISLSGAQVMTADGSSLNLNGGYIHYDGGIVNTTRLVDANGAIVPIGQASPFDTFVGIAGEFVESHPRWGVTNDWFDPLLSGGAYEPDFIVGGNAGTLNVFASQALVLDGGITAQAVGGSKQVQDGTQPAGGTFALGAGSALSALGGSTQDQFSGEPSNIIFQNSAPQLTNLAPGFGATTPLDTAALNALGTSDPDNLLAWQTVPVNTLNAGGFSNVSVTVDSKQGGESIVVPAGVQLVVQPGGSIALNGSVRAPIDILGSLIAPDGDISISLKGSAVPTPTDVPSDITVGPDARISVAGQWINDSDDSPTGSSDSLQGSEYINGGSISLSIDASSTGIPDGNSNTNVVDTTGSIVLSPGSLIDVSSGGYLQADGQLLMTNGIPRGSAGSLSLSVYNSAFGSSGAGLAVLPAMQPTAGQIEMDGTIRSAGFAGGGTLTMKALGFQIGGEPSAAPSWDVYLPADFFESQGFGSYVLNGMYDSGIAAGTTVRVTQQNLLPNLSALQHAVSGADLWSNGLTTIGQIDPYDRQPTNLTITGGAYLEWTQASGPLPQYPGVTGGVSVGQGASILADAGASIGLGSPEQVTVLGAIVAPGGSITLSANTRGAYGFGVTGQSTFGSGYTTDSQSVWLGPDALLDVAGVALTDPLATPVRNGSDVFDPHTGKVLPGGTVVLSDDEGYVVAQAGATIDVSGTSTTFDEAQSNGSYAAQPVWSNAGSITLAAANGLYFDGTLKAQAGAPQAQGGTLTILPEQQSFTLNSTQPGGAIASTSGASALVIQQSGALVPQGLAPGEDFTGAPSGVIEFSADTLEGSGITTLILGGSPGNHGYGNEPVPVVFAGNVNLSLGNAAVINADRLVALSTAQANDLLAVNPATGVAQTPQTLTQILAAQPVTGASGAPTVTIDAPYVALVGPAYVAGSAISIVPLEALADGALNINASFIDLENQIQLNNFGQANFISSSDIRLSSTDGAATGSTLQPGALFTPGNLTFTAADVYPSSGSTFILDAVGPTDPSTGAPIPTTITFEPNGSSGVPLSAGGSLLVDATDIVQSGTVRAPSGNLIFGVGDATDTATRTQFGNLTLVNTQSVAFANGSITSVSNDDTVIPYGVTVDGTEWQYNPTNGSSVPDVTAPPSKFISVNGSNVALNAGATIDLSGGGDLQAEEWVPGTGGSRDLLSQYNVSFATSTSGVAVPVNPGGGNVYAILPGKQSPAAAYDPVFAQTVQPSTNPNGSASTVTDSMGVGQAALNARVGQSVYLSGVPGLPAGYYTLLPAKYATLPGAFRVTVSNASGPAIPGASQKLPDGTEVVAGYLGNAFDGSRSATPTLFDVQSGAVWQQYSQYTLTSANSFFPALAMSAGNVAPQLPMDAGHLVLAATTGLTLGSTLNAAPAPGGAPAEVDIASQDIQIVGNGEVALPGYLQISADQLDALGAGSLLLGGTRTQTASGITIDAIANSVVVSNDAADPLSGPEIMLVTKTDPTSTDPNAVNGLRIDSGSVIAANGTYPAAKDVAITIGQNADSTTSTPAISGDGAFLSVTNGGDAVVTREDTTGTGLLTVDAGATLTGGQALTLDSSGNLSFNPSANLSGNVIAVDAAAITFTDQTGAAAAALPGFVVGASQIAQLAQAQEVILRSAGAMNFDGTVDATFGNQVDLSAGSFSSDGGAVTITAPQVEFTNEMGAPLPDNTTTGTGTLTVNAGEIDFGTGSKTLDGFSSVTFNATSGIVGQGTGIFDFGALPVTLNAPVYLADTAADATIKTTGVLNLNATAGAALALQPLGGVLTFVGGTLNDNGATIEAPAGNVNLEATSGDLTIAPGSVVSSAGVALPFFDITEYAPGGAITLIADQGTVNVQAGSTLDFSGAQGGGAAGSLTLSAPEQAVQLAGTINGNAASGFLGGSFSLNAGGAVDLDNLATELASSGVNDAITVQSNAGNLMLSAGNTLTAHVVSLTADGGAGAQDPNNGNVQIFGTINANGNAGGEIDLYGKSSVDVEGSLLARGSSATQRGGTINIGTSAVFDPNAINLATGVPNPYNATYGYENIYSQNSGAIVLGSGALIDVSGGTSGGLSGGTVNFRVPLLADGTINLTIDAFDAGKGVFGSRATTLEAYAVWSTTDATTGNQHFDGIVDPAGWYQVAGPNHTPQLVAGTFTDQSGNAISYQPGTYDSTTGTWSTATLSNDPGASWTQIQADLANDLVNDFFSPQAGDANTAHQQFYGYGSTTTNSDGSMTTTPGTLMGFVQTFQVAPTAANGLGNLANANLVVAPGIELDNPSTAINNGNISILTNWNLGSGSSPTDLDFRTAAGVAPTITFRAENNVKVEASLTDGFFQIVDPTQPGVTTTTVYVNITPPAAGDFHDSYHEVAYNSYYPGSNGYYGGKYTPRNPKYTLLGKWGGNLVAPAPVSAFGSNPDPTELAQYYGLYEEYVNEFLGGAGAAPGVATVLGQGLNGGFNKPVIPGQPVFTTPAPTQADELAHPDAWLLYVAQYSQYAQALIAWGNIVVNGVPNNRLTYNIVPLAPPPAVLTAAIQPSSTTTTITTGTPAPMDNSPSPVSTATNPLPLATASLNNGASSTFRLVAGANMNSADPLALQAAAPVGGAGGSVLLDGHFAYTDTNDRTLLQPTMIRTGSGSIGIAAADDVTLQDPVAPAVIYTAGTPEVAAPTGSNSFIAAGTASNETPDLLVIAGTNSDGGGDISIRALNDVTGIENVVDTSGKVTGVAGADASQFWWQWMQLGNVLDASGNILQTSIDFGAFDQGVMSVGGNVSVSAGGNITDLAVSLPTTWYSTVNAAGTQATNILGGGNLTVSAGGNILSGDYFVSKGTAVIAAGGQIKSDGLSYVNAGSSSVSTILAVQNGILDVSARQGADIGAVVDPSYIEGVDTDYNQHSDSQGYSSLSAVNVSATTGDIAFGTLTNLFVLGNNPNNLAAQILPATVNLTALSGGITVSTAGQLYPSSTGQLNLIADQSIVLSGQSPSPGQGGAIAFGMIDADPSVMPSTTKSIDESQSDPDSFLAQSPSASVLHSASPLHGNDSEPVRIYSLDGSVVDGTVDPLGRYSNLVDINTDKPTQIYAGNDIVNLAFTGQNLREDDVTRVVAGGNIVDAPATSLIFAVGSPVPALQLAGPGTFDIEAGGNIGPLTNQTQRPGSATGIDAIGNADNPFLPHESANVQVLFGVGPGIDTQAFISTYIDPASVVAGVPSVTPALISFMEQYDAGQGIDTGLIADKVAAQAKVGTLTADQAWSQFQTLPSYVQQTFAQQVLFSVLTDVGNDFNSPSSPFFQQYARGYQAINTLFPASLGYTANDLSGGVNGANKLITTGNLDIRSSTIQTQQGGNVSILGPGGQALIGSASAPPEIIQNGQVVAGPNTMGILTLEQGDINIFTDQSLLLAQSRIFTEQGGAMTIWSSNGDVNAGKGAKSVADVPAPEYQCDQNHYCTLDAKGEVSGAGIGILQTIPGVAPGNADLIAPRGTVDAGDAGIRVSGNLNVAALHVANADNIQVQGKATGIPVVAAVDTGALTAGSAATSAVTQMAQNLVRNNAAGVPQRHWIITVQVEGFGDSGGDNSDDSSKKRKPGTVSYDPSSAVSILGLGAVGNTQRAFLTGEEQGALGKVGKISNAGKI